MKLFKDSDNNIFAYENDGSQDDLIGNKSPITESEAAIIRQQKQQDIFNSLDYKQKRIMSYPSFGDQMDMLFHKGFDYWKEQIQAIKDEYPKE